MMTRDWNSWFPGGSPPKSVITSLASFAGARQPRVPRDRPAIQAAYGYAGDRLPTRARGLSESPQGLSELSRRYKLFLLFAPDVAHADGTNKVLRQCQRPGLHRWLIVGVCEEPKYAKPGGFNGKGSQTAKNPRTSCFAQYHIESNINLVKGAI